MLKSDRSIIYIECDWSKTSSDVKGSVVRHKSEDRAYDLYQWRIEGRRCDAGQWLICQGIFVSAWHKML